jgi:hypothetical protein
MYLMQKCYDLVKLNYQVAAHINIDSTNWNLSQCQ